MKLPAVCLAATFAGGVALGLFTALADLRSSVAAMVAGFVLSIALLAVSGVFVKRNLVSVAGSACLSAWLVLGILSAWIAWQPAPANHVLSLVSTGRINLSSPLRWIGHLRDEPAEFPWGTSLDLGLDSVEFEGARLDLAGGMRVTYSSMQRDVELPRLRAGDAVVIVAVGRLPQVFRNEGAFDRRAYLRQQGIDLTANLRSAGLLEKTGDVPLTISNTLAGVRSRLRHELSSLFPQSPETVGVLRAMLLGDRTFIDRDESLAFQKTGVFHVLVVAGLHVGAFAAFLFWLGRRLRLSIGWTTLLLLLVLTSYVAVIEQRPPVLRAALMPQSCSPADISSGISNS